MRSICFGVLVGSVAAMGVAWGTIIAALLRGGVAEVSVNSWHPVEGVLEAALLPVLIALAALGLREQWREAFAHVGH